MIGGVRGSAFAVVLAAVLLGVVACGGVTPTGGPAPTGQGSVASGDPTASPTADIPATPVPDPKHEVYGFVPYWEMDAGIVDHVADTELTTVALFSVTHRRSGALATNQNGYRRITGDVGDRLIREAHEDGKRVELVYTSFGETKNQRFYTEPKAQARWIRELVAFADELGVDGINVDVELLSAEYVQAYGDFVGRLRTALREVVPDGEVSVSTTAGPRGAAMAAAAVAAGADRAFLMGYDYHYEGSGPGASSPLDRFDGKDLDLAYSLDLYAAAGVPVERTLLGLPLYGVTWPVEGPEIGAAATDRGNEWIPRRNLRVFEDPDFSPTYEPIESVEFYAVERPIGVEGVNGDATPAPGEEGQWHAVYYDSARSLAPKLALADARGLAGAGFWAIGYERGLPEYTELIATFRDGKVADIPVP